MNTNENKSDTAYLNEEEQDIIEAFERGEFKPVKDMEQRKARLQEAANNTIKRRAINIRLNERDIRRIKILARHEGIPYKTLISSIVHRYAEGTLKKVD